MLRHPNRRGVLRFPLRGNDPALSRRLRRSCWARAWRLAGIRLVYGGGRVGLMGVVADAALAARGLGCWASSRAFLQRREVAHDGHGSSWSLTDTMHDRKRRMFEAAGAFVDHAGGARDVRRGHRDHHVAAAWATRQAHPGVQRRTGGRQPYLDGCSPLPSGTGFAGAGDGSGCTRRCRTWPAVLARLSTLPSPVRGGCSPRRV